MHGDHHGQSLESQRHGNLVTEAIKRDYCACEPMSNSHFTHQIVMVSRLIQTQHVDYIIICPPGQSERHNGDEGWGAAKMDG